MRAFRALFAWEMRQAVLRVSTWVFVGLHFLLALGAVLVAGGAFDDMFGGLGQGPNTIANSPQMLAQLIAFFTLMGLSITAALAGSSLHRDYEAGIESLLYSTPITKPQFLSARVSAALAVNLMILLGAALGAAIAAGSPLVKAARVIPFELSAYVEPFVMFVLPNLLLTMGIFVALVILTRQMLPVYVGGVLLLIGYLISSALLDNLDNKRLAALLDPFALNVMDYVTQYWSVSEQNARHIPWAPILLWNRAIWLAVGIGIFVVAYRRFRFAYAAGDSRAKATAHDEILEAARPRSEAIALPAVDRRYDATAHARQLRSVARRAFAGIVRSRYFAAIMVGALIFLGVGAWQAGRLYGTPTWPVTYQVEEILTGTMTFLMLVIVVMYSGELVWADRDQRTNQLVDSMPTPTWVMMLGKALALAAMIVTISVLLLLTGIVTQIVKGYYRFELPVYLEALFGIRLIAFLLLIPFSMCVHVLLNQKVVAHFAIVLGLLGMGLLPLAGLDQNFFRYGADSGIMYSDMNGWGLFLAPYVWWNAYWAAVGVLLLVLTHLLWFRGEAGGLRQRLRIAGARFTRGVRLAAGIGAASWAGLGGFLWYNTNRLNIHRTAAENRQLRAEREKRYKRFENAPQPRIMAVTVRVDLEPQRQAAHILGSYVLRNKTRWPIDSVHLNISEEMSIRSLDFDGGSRHVRADSVRDYHIYRLTRPLQPGDSTTMRFELAYRARGIPNRVTNTFLVPNGTFLSSSLFLPRIGYSRDEELTDEDERRKQHLPAHRERMRAPTDTAGWRNNYVSQDADWVRFDATVSTDADQTAIAPGYLQRDWMEHGRHVFHYTMDAPILNFWAVLSGRYAVRHDSWRDPRGGDSAQVVDIAVYHHPAHTYNVSRMIASVQRSLDYYTRNFGPYQHRQVRILEFPRYASFAQSLPNMIPYSEAIGFIARVEKADDIDYPFYVTAHEVAHAWWAHQTVGADVRGAAMLSETMAQYSSLMVMEHEYGAKNMRRFLAYELHNYLIQRGFGARGELPLELVQMQPAVYYHKGSLVMYALRDYIGEQRVNDALRSFLDSTKFRGPPYPTSLQLVDAFRRVTPDSLRYLITDLFETITLYDFRTDSAIVSRDGADSTKYRVDLWVKARKLRADSLGRETPIAMRDWVDIGIYAQPPKGVRQADANGIPVYLAKQRVDSGAQHFTIVVDRAPARAGIDPLHKLIDRLTDDNVVPTRDAVRPRKR